jgi:hypothetical protein
VPRERVKTIWASKLENARFRAELAEFRAAIARLPRGGWRDSLPSVPDSALEKTVAAVARETEESAS